jgi:putative DNA primase/helicase
VNDHNSGHVLKFLTKQEETLAITRTHSKLGFNFEGEGITFQHYQVIGGDSTYSGDFAIKPSGTRASWLSLIRKQVIGHPPMELALLMGLAAPVASLIGKVTGLDVMVFHLYGNSSQGKTTATMLAVSPFGSPNDKEDGSLVRSWNSTTYALLAELRDNHGVPMAFDEASMKDSDFGSLIYMLASGKDKGRLDKNSNKKEAGHWSGTFLSNGEHALTTKSVKNIGIQMRITEFADIPWTKSAQHSDILKEGLVHNFGYAGPEFVTWLLQYGLNNIIACWKQWKEHFAASIANPDHYTSRISDRMAVLLATADMAGQALGLSFDLEGIQKILLATVNEAKDSRNLGEKAYQYLIDKIIEHEGKFSSNNSRDKYPINEHWGKIIKDTKTEEWQEIWILPEKFREILSNGGFQDTKVILGTWREQQRISCDPDRYTRSKRIVSGLQQKVHVIKVSSSS